jgi:hypothetical protein
MIIPFSATLSSSRTPREVRVHISRLQRRLFAVSAIKSLQRLKYQRTKFVSDSSRSATTPHRITKPFRFTSDVAVIQKNLSSLVAAGGGNGPEVQTAAMAAALDLNWAEDAIKMVVLITDAPPHGLGEAGDGFSKSPDRKLLISMLFW